MKTRTILIIALLTATACSSDLAKRLAPPGIVKYEHIADEKPANPTVANLLEESPPSKNVRFPKIGDTPAASRVNAPAFRAAERRLFEIQKARAALDLAIAEDRATSETELEARALDEEAARIEKEIEELRALAAQEKRSREQALEQ